MKPQLPAAVPALLSLPVALAAVWDGHATIDSHKFDFSSLGGRHEIMVSELLNPSYKNTTYAINPTGALPRLKDEKEEDFCAKGAQVCLIDRIVHPPKMTEGVVERVVNIAGELEGANENEKKGEVTFEKLGDDKEKDGERGVRVTIPGGRYKETAQAAVVEFVCDADRTGLEGVPERKDEGKKTRRAEDGGKKEEEQQPSLSFVSYDTGKEPHTLTLRWRTKHACVDAESGGDDKGADGGSSGWGFFTWMVIILFMLVAAYLIFGSWLNYNRYGARGFDLLPHADTIRDLPYLFKDFARRVASTLQGGSRGGYSAV